MKVFLESNLPISQQQDKVKLQSGEKERSQIQS